VLSPMGADQPRNAARCAELGLARVLDAVAATPAAVRDAVSGVLADPGYRRAAERLRDEIAAQPGPEDAVRLLERIARPRPQVQIAVDCADPDKLADFWADVLGYAVEKLPSGPDWSAVVDPDGTGPRLLFHRVPEPKITKNRLHLDVRAGGPRGTPKQAKCSLVDAEVERLTARGATHVRTIEDEDDYFAVMLDPEGNEFCVC
jgi:catechol 2,3-dioxygenase-like lactoylglutathione lyase family enzyme